jgi:hypothetical protein
MMGIDEYWSCQELGMDERYAVLASVTVNEVIGSIVALSRSFRSAMRQNGAVNNQRNKLTRSFFAFEKQRIKIISKSIMKSADGQGHMNDESFFTPQLNFITPHHSHSL